MARYEKESFLNAERILEKASSFFGPDGLGLRPSEAEGGCTTFEGGGGHVSVHVCKSGERSHVELETREWDYQVQKFMNKI
jgi:hypothetical protein